MLDYDGVDGCLKFFSDLSFLDFFLLWPESNELDEEDDEREDE
jgi:hypothetical protein